MYISSAAFAASIEVQGTSSLNLSSSLTVSGPITVTVDASFNWSSGTLTCSAPFENFGTINMLTTSTKTLQTSTINNHGTMNFGVSGVVLAMSNGAILNNQSGATIDIMATSGSGIYNVGTGGVLNNYGTLRKSDGVSYVIQCPLIITMPQLTFKWGNLT